MTSLDFTACRVTEFGELCLTPTNPAMARNFALRHDPKRTYTAEIRQARNRRSLDANAYFWVLAGKLAAATGVPKSEIYQRAVRDIGGNCDTCCMVEAAAKRMAQIWRKRGLGWQAELGDSKLEGCKTVVLYYGSSTYDTAQMARLIDNIVQDCHACGVETLTPAELALLVDDWGCSDGAK